MEHPSRSISHHFYFFLIFALSADALTSALTYAGKMPAEVEVQFSHLLERVRRLIAIVIDHDSNLDGDREMVAVRLSETPEIAIGQP